VNCGRAVCIPANHTIHRTQHEQLVQFRTLRRLIREFDLRIGHNGLERIRRERGLLTAGNISQAGPGARQGAAGVGPPNQRGYQGSGRHSAPWPKT
jgi:hypothetical protein